MISKRESIPAVSVGLEQDRGDDWRDDARCKDTDGDAFYAEGPGGQVSSAVLNVCAACPVAQACLDHALTFPERFGIWGGTSPLQRARMKPGTVAPILTRPRCKTCGGVTSPRRVKCDGCIETAELERQVRHRETNKRAIEEAS